MGEQQELTRLQADQREKLIVRTSIIGILANVFLAGFKAVVGLLSNSIAVVLDAVNNLSDALSSVITIIGTKLAGRKPDKDHPFGHGRAEYLSALIVSSIILAAGVTSLIESVKKIMHPEKADYSVTSLVIIGTAVVVKFLLGRYVKSVGKRVQSGSLAASGSDALFDAILSASVFASAVIYMTTGLALEAYVGVFIAAVILKSGIEMMLETIGDILGRRPDPELSRKVKRAVIEDPEVQGAYDLTLHNYGPELIVGSVHVAVPDTMTADRIDEMSRRVVDRVQKETGVILMSVGIYSVNTKQDEAAEMRAQITKCVMSHEGVLQVHGFYVSTEKKEGRLDAVIDFSVPDREALAAEMTEEVRRMYPEYNFIIVADIDSSD